MKLKSRNHYDFRRFANLNGALKAFGLWGTLVAGLPMIGTAGGLDEKPANEGERREKLYLIRAKQIPLMEDFVKKHGNTPQAAEIYMRLGEAHFEMAKYYDSKGDHARSQLEVNKALGFLDMLRTQFPTFKRLDEALFVMANSYIEMQQMDKAGEVLAQIADRYPQSPVLKQAALLLGDHYFEKGLYARSESYYQTAVQNPKSASYVNYKLAWVSINQNQPGRALGFFEKVLQLKAAGGGGDGDYSKDAAREMVFPALQVHGPKKIMAYLKGVIQDDALIQSSLESLAKGLLARADYDLAGQTYEALQSSFPQSPSMNEWIAAQLKVEETLGRTSKISTLVARMNQGGAASPEVQGQLMNTARKFHAEAQKVQAGPERNRLYDLAIGYYSAYLQTATVGTPVTANVQFYLGEALYSRERFADANIQYENSSKVKTENQAKAAWNFFLTSERLASGFRYQGKELHATDASDEKYLQAARDIQSVEGITLDQKRKASYQSARLLYQLNDLERALPIFQFLADNHASSQEGKLSANLVLDIYNLRKDYKSVAQYARSYQAKADGGMKTEFGALEQTALLKGLEEEERAAKTKEGSEKFEALEQVADHYFEFAKSYPNSTHVDATVWAAYQGYASVSAERKDRTFTKMREAFKMLTQKYSSSKYAPQAVSIMGKYLAQQAIDGEILRDFSSYRTAFMKDMRSEPREKRGTMGMMVFRLSSDSERKALVREFAELPLTDENRTAYAHVQLLKLEALKEKLYSVKLDSLKTLNKNVQSKIALLEKLQNEVTEHIKLKVGDTAVPALHMLGDGYKHVASALKHAPIPKKLDGDNLVKYQAAVGEKASGLEQKGEEAHKLAEEKARELNLSSAS